MPKYYNQWAKNNESDYYLVLAHQDYGCGICKKNNKELVVDHDHVTNLIRGLLCVSCNIWLGHHSDGTYRVNRTAPMYLFAVQSYLLNPPAAILNFNSKVARSLMDKSKPTPGIPSSGGQSAPNPYPVPSQERPNKAQEILERTGKLLEEMNFHKPEKPKRTRNKKRKEQTYSGKGYVYTYDKEGKPIPKGRALMEAKLGRPLHAYEVIVYLDNDRRNCEIENLAIGFKGNSPITALRCEHCGTVGEISLILP